MNSLASQLFESVRSSLTAKQARKVEQLVRGYEHKNAAEGVTEVDIETLLVNPRFISLCIRTRRTDCDQYSPRQFYCQDGGMFFIGVNGGAKMVSRRAIGPSDPKARRAFGSRKGLALELWSICYAANNPRPALRIRAQEAVTS